MGFLLIVFDSNGGNDLIASVNADANFREKT